MGEELEMVSIDTFWGALLTKGIKIGAVDAGGSEVKLFLLKNYSQCQMTYNILVYIPYEE